MFDAILIIGAMQVYVLVVGAIYGIWEGWKRAK